MRKIYRHIAMGAVITALLLTLSACGQEADIESEKADIGAESGHSISVSVQKTVPQEENISKVLETEVRNEENEKVDMAVPADSQKSEPEESNVEKSEANKPAAQPKKAEDKDSVTADKSKDKAEAPKKNTAESSKETVKKTEPKKDTKKSEAEKTTTEPKKTSGQSAEKKTDTKPTDSSPKADNTKKNDSTKKSGSETSDTGKKPEQNAGKNEDSADNQSKPKHVHDWQPVYETKLIDDIESELHEFCKGCGADITEWSNEKWHEHTDMHMDNGDDTGFIEKEVQVVTATHKVEHLKCYKCSCGATKAA